MKSTHLPARWVVLGLALLSISHACGQDFDTEIMPILTKSGCNAGSCHGAAAGRGEFRLSLLGSDPASDHRSIVNEYEGRRLNRISPRLSLLLSKPTGQLEHGGDVVLDEAGTAAKLLESWIAAGAKRTGQRQMTQFDVTPQRTLATEVDAVVRLQAIASFSDGTTRDVTPWTQFTAADDYAVSIATDPSGEVLARVKRRGQHVIIARFLSRVLPVELIVPLADTPIDLSGYPRANFIDDQILTMLSDLRIEPAGRAQANELIRRLYLDLVGRLPSPEELAAFEADSSDQAYSTIVDRLLHSDGFADYWTLKFSRWLRVHSLPNETQIVSTYTSWIHQSLRSGLGFDDFARELLTASGDSHVVGPANFSRMVSGARDQAELVSQFFLGSRMECANCHDHPLDRWTQDDYHGLAAIFSKLERGREVRLNRRGGVTHPRTGEPARAKLPGDRFLEASPDQRVEFADWLSRPDNRYLARSMVNRLWRAMLGRGLIEPVDDLRETNPATHPELLDRLADDFVVHGYRIRHTLKLIATSETYRRSHRSIGGGSGGEQVHDDRFYSRSYYRPLEPEVLVDAIADVTGARPRSATGTGTDESLTANTTRAITLYDPLTPAPSLDILGRCSRVGTCAESGSGAGLAGKLHLINGELINAQLSDPAASLHQSIESGRTNREILTQWVRRALCQTPSRARLQSWLEQAPPPGDPERAAWLEDFAWSLLNSRDFTHNH